MNKIATILLITLFLITSILFFSHPLYTGFVTQDECSSATCASYPDAAECNADICSLSCYHDGTACMDYTPTSCDEIQTEDLCIYSTLNCEYNTTDCVDYGSQTTEPEAADTSELEDNIQKLTNFQADPEKSQIAQTLNIDLNLNSNTSYRRRHNSNTSRKRPDNNQPTNFTRHSFSKRPKNINNSS